MTEKEIYDYVFKFILIGNGSCGKTSLLYYFIHQKGSTFKFTFQFLFREESTHINDRSRIFI